MLKNLPPFTSSQMTVLIEEHIHNIRNREILKLRLLDGMTYERIAETEDMSVRQIKNIVYRDLHILIRHL